jgi:hypothetical protein
MAATLDLRSFVMKGGYTIKEEGDDYVIQYLIEKPTAAAAAKVPVAPVVPAPAAGAVKPAAAVATVPVVSAPAAATTELATGQQIEYKPTFFEEQTPGLLGCGRHALNNLFHNTYFIKDGSYEINDSNIGATLPTPIPLNTLCKYLYSKEKYRAILDTCSESEYYDIQILIAGLGIVGHATTEIWNTATRTITNTERLKNPIGYIINYGKYHWVALRKRPMPYEGKSFEYIDSMSSTKEYYGTLDEYLNAYKNKKRIVNILGVDAFTAFINPLTTLDNMITNPTTVDDIKNGKSLETKKEELDAAFIPYVADDRLKAPIGVDTVERPGGSAKNGYYPKNTPLSEYIYDNLLFTITSPEEGDTLLNYLRTKSDNLIPILANNKAAILAITPRSTAEFIAFIIAELGKLGLAGGSRRRKTLRLQARQKPGRRALTHKQVHHKEDENA